MNKLILECSFLYFFYVRQFHSEIFDRSLIVIVTHRWLLIWTNQLKYLSSKKSKCYQKKAGPLYRIVKLLRNENGIEKVYLKHLNLSLSQTNPNQLGVSDSKFCFDKDSGFLHTNIPVGENLLNVLGSLPSLSPEHEKYVAENKSASDIRKGGVKHSRGFNLFASSDTTIKLFEESFTNTVSKIFRSKIFIEDSFFAIYEGRSAATPHHHLNTWDNEFSGYKGKCTFSKNNDTYNCLLYTSDAADE